MQEYVLGFVQDLDGHRVLLILKNRPEALAGLLNGIGGSIESGETPTFAMSRELTEETGLVIPEEEWVFLGEYGRKGYYMISVFGGVADLNTARTMTDEPIKRVYWHEIDKLAQDGKLAPGVIDILSSIRPPHPA